MPGSLQTPAPASTWATATEREFRFSGNDILRGFYVHLTGLVTGAAGWDPAVDLLNHFPAGLLARIRVDRDNESLADIHVLSEMLTAQYDGWNPWCIVTPPVAGAGGPVVIDIVVPVRMNPDALASLTSGAPYEVDLRGSAATIVRVLCGTVALCSPDIASFTLTALTVIQAKDFTKLDPGPFMAALNSRRRKVGFQQIVFGAAGQQTVNLPTDGAIRRVTVLAQDAAGGCSDLLLGNVELVAGSASVPFRANFADLCAWTRAKSAQPLRTNQIGGTVSATTGGFAVLEMDEDGFGGNANMISGIYNPIMNITAAAACTVTVVTEIVRKAPTR